MLEMALVELEEVVPPREAEWETEHKAAEPVLVSDAVLGSNSPGARAKGSEGGSHVGTKGAQGGGGACMWHASHGCAAASAMVARREGSKTRSRSSSCSSDAEKASSSGLCG